LTKEHPDRLIAVIVPELVERRWYHYLLHNHAASVLKALLLFVINTPWYLEDWRPERQRLLRWSNLVSAWRRRARAGAPRRAHSHVARARRRRKPGAASGARR